MFDAIITANTLEDTLASISVLVDECKINLTDDGWEIRAVDPANVGMSDVSLPTDAFESYTADGGVLGVNINRLEDVIGMADSDDLVHFELDEETRKLHINIDGLEYTLALIDPDSIREEPDIPDLDLPGNVVIEGSELDRAITATDMVSDHVILSIDDAESEFVVEANGDTDDVVLRMDEEDYIELTPNMARSLFSLDYLKDMNKAIDKDAEVEIELGEEFPMKMHFGLADGAGRATYFLAPRITSD